MFSILWTIVISLAWIVLAYAGVMAYLFFGKKKDSLAMLVYALMLMFIPVIIFVFMNIMCWVNEANRTVYLVIMGILAGIFIGGPILYFLGKNIGLLILYPPKKMAKYAAKTVGKFSNFNRGRDGSHLYSGKHYDEQSYIARQYWVMCRKLGIVYQARSRRGKEAYLRAMLDYNVEILPQLVGWEYHTILHGLYEGNKDVLLQFDDGEKAPYYLFLPKVSFSREDLTEEDRKKYDHAKKYSRITMTGRLIYIFMCIERYLTSLYPDRDWTPVARRLWSITKNKEKWDEGLPGNWYREIVPERIMRFYKSGYGYKQLNPMVFDDRLSEEVYTEIRKLYEGLSKGERDEEINQMVGLPENLLSRAERNIYVEEMEEPMVDACLKAEGILEKRGIGLPDFSLIEQYSFARPGETMKGVDRKTAFGFGVDAEELSIILH